MKTNRKPSDDADKPKKARKPRGKKGETTPAGKGRESTPPPPPPPPAAAPQESDSIDTNDGREVLKALRYVLAVAPKAKDQPGLSFVVVEPHYLKATDDYALHMHYLDKPIAEAAVKVTLASAEALAAVLAGEIKASESTEGRVDVRWSGLVVEIRRTGADPHTMTLDRCDHGPRPEDIAVKLPDAFEAAATLPAKALARALDRGDHAVGAFVSTGSRMVVLDELSGDATVARAFVAFRGASLGIRQMPMPMATGPAPAARPATMGPRPPVVDAEIIGELPAPSAWVQIECNRSEAWDRIPAAELADLTPYTVDEARGMVVWGPWPRGSLRLRQVWARLVRLGMEPREVPCQTALPLELDTGASGEPRQLGAGDASPEREGDEPSEGVSP
jgi:hypothetical protein